MPNKLSVKRQRRITNAPIWKPNLGLARLKNQAGTQARATP
jgi:hypothetical protein